jgi:hypothetical protein
MREWNLEKVRKELKKGFGDGERQEERMRESK